jgi:LmbE family N-acetylglucosaminyl deacetylase
MQNAAAFFGAELTLASFADVMENVGAAWDAQACSHASLVARITAAISAERPTVIYTFDPDHGSTCHPAHRVVGQLVVESVRD